MWYQKTAKEILSDLNVELANGLTCEQVGERLRTFGPNVFAKGKKETLFDIFIRQFKSPLVYILIIAAVLIVILGQSIDAIVILVVVTFNAVIGTFQEGRAQNSLERLKSLTRHKVLVRRAGEEVLISSEEVVCGDILIFNAGDKVAADARIVKAEELAVNESILTGEAYTAFKSANVIKKNKLVLGDQKNMLFAGTGVVSGWGEAVVVAIGLESELGKISKQLLETKNVPLPLAKKVFELTRFIAITVFLIGIITFSVGLIRGIELREIFGVVIGLSVSVVPEGLPVALTIVLARGVWRMAKAHAIVRQMAAVEAMGGADILMIDKTGTITTGQMVIADLYYNGTHLKIDGQGYDPSGKIKLSIKRTGLKRFLSLVYLSLKADVIFEEHGGWKPVGDSTEAAIAVLCKKMGLSKEKLLEDYKTVLSKPFDQKKKYIEAIFTKGREKWEVFVGAPEYLIDDLRLDHNILADYHSLAKKGLRVIGAAILGPKKVCDWALMAIEEEIRETAKESILEAKKAGFRVVIATGDFAETAKAIARRVGIYQENDEVLTGSQIEQSNEEEFLRKIDKASVFARITPEHKFRIVNAFKRRGHIVAMTGDGVNDAPALSAANLGIGLGSGTQVAKDASDIVLVDNNLETIIGAIFEGRSIYLSLKKVVLYLFSTSFGEVLVITGAIFIGLPLPLVAVQIIWLNFVTDGFFVVALAQDKPKEGLITRSEVESESLIDNLMIKRTILMGFSMFVVALPIFYIFMSNYSILTGRTMVLLVLSMTQWFNALNVRSRSVSIFKRRLDNFFLIASFGVVLILQILVVQTPWGNELMHTESLSLGQWVIAFLASTVIIWVEEVRKFFARNNWQAADGRQLTA